MPGSLDLQVTDGQAPLKDRSQGKMRVVGELKKFGSRWGHTAGCPSSNPDPTIALTFGLCAVFQFAHL